MLRGHSLHCPDDRSSLGSAFPTCSSTDIRCHKPSPSRGWTLPARKTTRSQAVVWLVQTTTLARVSSLGPPQKRSRERAAPVDEPRIPSTSRTLIALPRDSTIR